jgi:hypothetical protein
MSPIDCNPCIALLVATSHLEKFFDLASQMM